MKKTNVLVLALLCVSPLAFADTVRLVCRDIPHQAASGESHAIDLVVNTLLVRGEPVTTVLGCTLLSRTSGSSRVEQETMTMTARSDFSITFQSGTRRVLTLSLPMDASSSYEAILSLYGREVSICKPPVLN